MRLVYIIVWSVFTSLCYAQDINYLDKPYTPPYKHTNARDDSNKVANPSRKPARKPTFADREIGEVETMAAQKSMGGKRAFAKERLRNPRRKEMENDEEEVEDLEDEEGLSDDDELLNDDIQGVDEAPDDTNDSIDNQDGRELNYIGDGIESSKRRNLKDRKGLVKKPNRGIKDLNKVDLVEDKMKVADYDQNHAEDMGDSNNALSERDKVADEAMSGNDNDINREINFDEDKTMLAEESHNEPKFEIRDKLSNDLPPRDADASKEGLTEDSFSTDLHLKSKSVEPAESPTHPFSNIAEVPRDGRVRLKAPTHLKTLTHLKTPSVPQIAARSPGNFAQEADGEMSDEVPDASFVEPQRCNDHCPPGGQRVSPVACNPAGKPLGGSKLIVTPAECSEENVEKDADRHSKDPLKENDPYSRRIAHDPYSQRCERGPSSRDDRKLVSHGCLERSGEVAGLKQPRSFARRDMQTAR